MLKVTIWRNHIYMIRPRLTFTLLEMYICIDMFATRLYYTTIQRLKLHKHAHRNSAVTICFIFISRLTDRLSTHNIVTRLYFYFFLFCIAIERIMQYTVSSKCIAVVKEVRNVNELYTCIAWLYEPNYQIIWYECWHNLYWNTVPEVFYLTLPQGNSWLLKCLWISGTFHRGMCLSLDLSNKTTILYLIS